MDYYHFTYWLTLISFIVLPQELESRDLGVTLFQWPFREIAIECEKYLGFLGYTKVQVGPIQMHRKDYIYNTFPWWLTYQPISLEIGNRLGSSHEFQEMVQRCKKAGVQVIVDVVINHFADKDLSDNVAFTGFSNGSYQVRPWSTATFHQNIMDGVLTERYFHDRICDHEIRDYANDTQVYNCRLGSLIDVATEKRVVQSLIGKFLDDLVGVYGVSGFRIDAAKHIPLADLHQIMGKMKHRSFFLGLEIMYPFESDMTYKRYDNLGMIYNFEYGNLMSKFFMNDAKISDLNDFFQDGSKLSSERSIVFPENHDTERMFNWVNSITNPREYELVTSLCFLYPWGTLFVHSGFLFPRNETFSSAPYDSKTGFILGPYSKEGKAWMLQHRNHNLTKLIAIRSAIWKERLKMATIPTSYPVIYGETKRQLWFRPSPSFVVVINGEPDLEYSVSISKPFSLLPVCDLAYATDGEEGCLLRPELQGLLRNGEKFVYETAYIKVSVTIKPSHFSQISILRINKMMGIYYWVTNPILMFLNYQ